MENMVAKQGMVVRCKMLSFLYKNKINIDDATHQ